MPDSGHERERDSASCPDRYRLDDLVSCRLGYRLWRGFDLRLARPVAVRVVDARDPRADAVAEAAVRAAGVDSRRVVRVLDVSRTWAAVTVVSEWFDAIALGELLTRPLAPATAARITREAARAVAALHRSESFHGRLRPNAVLIDAAGEVRLRGHELDAALWAREPALDARLADVHGLGALLTACLCARWPDGRVDGLDPVPLIGHRLASPGRLVADVPPELDRLAMRALAASAALGTAPANLRATRRPITDAETVAASLASWAGSPPRAAPDWGSDQIAPPATQNRVGARRRGALAAAAAASAALMLMGTMAAASGIQVLAASVAASPGPVPVATPHLQPRRLLAPARDFGETTFPVLRVGVLAPDGPQLGAVAARAAIDGDPGTAWYSPHSEHAQPSEPAAILVDLGTPRPVRVIELRLVGNDTNLIVSTTARNRPAVRTFRALTQVAGAPSRVVLRTPRPRTARYVLIQLTEVPWENNGYRGGITEVAIRGG